MIISSVDLLTEGWRKVLEQVEHYDKLRNLHHFTAAFKT